MTAEGGNDHKELERKAEAEGAVKLGDEAPYRAKEPGRNCVELTTTAR